MDYDRHDAGHDFIELENAYFMKKYQNRFMEYDEESDDYFEIEDQGLVRDILADIREDLNENIKPHNRYYYEKPLAK